MRTRQKQRCATLSETLQNKMHACKTRLDFKIQGMISIQNEIRTRSERDTNLHNLRPLRDETGQHPVYTRAFLLGVPDGLKPQKRDTRLKNETAWTLVINLRPRSHVKPSLAVYTFHGHCIKYDIMFTEISSTNKTVLCARRWLYSVRAVVTVLCERAFFCLLSCFYAPSMTSHFYKLF